MSLQRITWIVYCLWISLIVQECYGQSLDITAHSPTNVALNERDSATFTCSFDVADRDLVQFVWLRQKHPEEYDGAAGTRIKAIKDEKEHHISSMLLVKDGKNDTRFINEKAYATYRMPDQNMSSLVIDDINVMDEGYYFCYIFNQYSANPVKDDWDNFTLGVFVPPVEASIILTTGDDKGWLQENNDTTFTCTIPRVKPNVTTMEITLGNQTLTGTITETSNEDKTYSNSYTVTTNVSITDNGKKVTCEAMWQEGSYTKEESIRVISKVEPPKYVSVNPGAESCQVKWKKDQNAKTVFVCYGTTTGDCENVTVEEACKSATEPSELTIESLEYGAKYCIWLYASNELGNSTQKSTNMSCTPMEATTTAPATTAHSVAPSPTTPPGVDIGLIAGLGCAGLVVLICVFVVICIVLYRRKAPDEVYSDVDKSKKASSNVTAAAPNDEESPYADGPAVPAKAPDLVRELNGESPYGIVHMENQNPDMNSDHALANVGKKAKKAKKEKKPKSTANGNAAPDQVTQPSSSNVPPRPSKQNNQPSTKPETHSASTQGPKVKQDDETKLYAEVALQQPTGPPPKPRSRMKDTEYQAVKFRKGPRAEDDDSD